MWRLGLIIPIICLGVTSHSQLWNGVIDPSRAINWTNAGIQGGIPSATWTQCGSTITPSTALSRLNAQLARCSAKSYVLMEEGTYNYAGTINIPSNVVLRGSGANKTFIIETAGIGACDGIGGTISICGDNSSPGSEQNVCDWTVGYAPGTTTITLANCGSTTPARGAIRNLKVGNLVFLDQLDEVSDSGHIWNCATKNSCSNTTQSGDARANGSCSGPMCLRSQQQGVIVTSCDGKSSIGHACSSGSNITIYPGLYMSNWRSGQKPQAWYANYYIKNAGVENLSIDNTNATGNHAINLFNCIKCWVSGVRSLRANRSHVNLQQCDNCTLQNSYFYQNVSHFNVSYGVELANAFDSLILNNISQQVTDSTPSCTGPCAGNVIAYNLGINTHFTTAGWFQPSFYLHASGDELNLWEGNIGTGFSADIDHGTHHFETLFRNYFTGWQADCASSPCTSNTVPIALAAGSRYFNVIANVLGQPGYHDHYQCNASSATSCAVGNHAGGTGRDTEIYMTGYTGNGGQASPSIAAFCTSQSCTSTSDYDPQTGSYRMFWGNYDTVSAVVSWNASEVPTGVNPFGNAVPTSTCTSRANCPVSFYYLSKPSWWPRGKAWPPIGPDVTGGNLGLCSGGAYKGAYAGSSSLCRGGAKETAFDGHVNSIPALDCYWEMGGPADGSGSALIFNADTCYTVTRTPASR